MSIFREKSEDKTFAQIKGKGWHFYCFFVKIKQSDNQWIEG